MAIVAVPTPSAEVITIEKETELTSFPISEVMAKESVKEQLALVVEDVVVEPVQNFWL